MNSHDCFKVIKSSTTENNVGYTKQTISQHNICGEGSSNKHQIKIYLTLSAFSLNKDRHLPDNKKLKYLHKSKKVDGGCPNYSLIVLHAKSDSSYLFTFS
jgi:hypothetical protein